MRRTIAALLATGTLVVGGAASGTAATTPDLSTPEAVDAYLVSQGVDPATVVRQSGLNNYAGPASGCPGAGWSCTTATRVVQIAQEGGENRASCEGGTLSVVEMTQTCVIMQMDGTNHAACKLRATTEAAAQHCTITQTGDTNSALVDEVIDQSDGAMQEAVQTATITQTATGNNSSQLHQSVKQTTRVAGSQIQQVRQRGVVTQTATGAGNNTSHVHQGQDQTASGAAAAQAQNWPADPFPVVDCAGGPGSPDRPNACANVMQTSVDGNNVSQLRQLANQAASTTVTGASQTQGSPTGGNDGAVHQTVVGTGSSTNHAVQKKRQRLSGPAGSQLQYDPTGCCGISQVGGVANHENVDQESVQSASATGVATQFTTITGSSRIVSGDLLALSLMTGGGCDVMHHARNNDDATTAHFSDPAPCIVVAETICVSGSVEVEQVKEGFCASREVPPPGDDVESVGTTAAATPTLGQEVEPLDVTAATP